MDTWYPSVPVEMVRQAPQMGTGKLSTADVSLIGQNGAWISPEFLEPHGPRG